jgi:hypothetical protein
MPDTKTVATAAKVELARCTYESLCEETGSEAITWRGFARVLVADACESLRERACVQAIVRTSAKLEFGQL